MRFVFVALICVSCGGSQAPRQEPLSSRWTAPTMLAQVPADSPYLMAMLEPVPEAVKQQMFDSLDRKIETAHELSRGVDRAGLEPPLRAYFAMLDELDGKNLRQWGQQLGFDPSGRFVVYGLSVWPVLRIAVANEARLRQVLGKMLAAAGAPTAPRTLHGRDYWQLDTGKVSIVGSVVDREAVFAVLPTPALAEYLPLVLGQTKPARSLHGNGSLNELIGRYRFLASMVGYVDTRFAADILAGRASSSNSELDRPLRTALGPVSDACRADIDRLAGYVPRVVFGYRRLDTKGMHATMALELAPAMAAALQRVRTAVPDLPEGLGAPAMLRFGVAAKLDELVPLLRQATAHVRARPFACSWFAPLGEASARLAELLDTPLPPALHGLRGFSVVLDDATIEPFVPRGHAILVADHAHDLVTLGLQSAGMGGTVVHPDGRPVQLPLVQLGAPASLSAYAATRVERAAVSVGPTSATEVVEVLQRPAPARSPLLSFGFDLVRMLEIGWLDPEDGNGMRDVVLQIDAAPEGIVLEMYATLGAH